MMTKNEIATMLRQGVNFIRPGGRRDIHYTRIAYSPERLGLSVFMVHGSNSAENRWRPLSEEIAIFMIQEFGYTPAPSVLKEVR